MRDVGFLVWIVLLFIGVIGSVVSNVRRRAQAPARPVSAPASSVARAPMPVAPQPIVAPAPAPPPSRPVPGRQVAPPQPARPARSAGRLFATKPELVRAVIAAEVFGKPKALRDE